MMLKPLSTKHIATITLQLFSLSFSLTGISNPLPAETAPHSKIKPTSPAPKSVAPKGYYTVKLGDSLAKVSSETGIALKDLIEWNHLTPPYTIYLGAQLKLFANIKQTPPASEKPNQPIKKTEQSVTQSAKPNNKTTANKPLHAPIAGQEKEKKSTISNTQQKVLKLSFKWPLTGRLLRTFNETNKQGIEIENKTQRQKVLAAADGAVVYVGKELSAFRNLVIIKHSADYLSAYANTSRLLIKEGRKVKTGDVIAEMDNVAKKNVLHFEIRKNGYPVDPIKLLPH